MIFALEKFIKQKLFNCQTCGQCVLSQTAMSCPMNCPKGLRNGPCGGTLEGTCEVLAKEDCIWMKIETNLKNDSCNGVRMPLDPELINTSSYLNFFTGKDRATRKPNPFIQVPKLREQPASRLATKLTRGDFVITAEIHSPRKRSGLSRVERYLNHIAPYVDAINTTTNAGGVPSLHSTETAGVVTAAGAEAVIQFCGRDHHAPDFIHEMEHALNKGHRNFLLLTGDWLPQKARVLDQRHWFPMDSSQMIQLASEHAAHWHARFGFVPLIGGASNPASTPSEIALRRWGLKVSAGARFTQTQIVTNLDAFENWYALLQANPRLKNIPILVSLPMIGNMKSFRIMCDLPGVRADANLLSNLQRATNLPQAGQEWICKAITRLRALGVAGVHLMNFGMPFERASDIFQYGMENKIESKPALTLENM